MLSGKVALYDSHGNQDPELGWYAEVDGDSIVPVQMLYDELLSFGYQTVLFSACNPEPEHIMPKNGMAIYPLGKFDEGLEFETVVRSS